MNFNELLDSYDKKFYKLSEIEKIAKQQAEKHIKGRNKLSKLSHIIGSQQTAVDVYKDLQREIELRQTASDPLEKISGFVQVLIVTKKCELIVSVKTCEYKEAYNNFLKDYITETKSFVELQYKEAFDSVLLNHLKDALGVLKERGNIKAEKRLQELPNYEKLLSTYKLLTSKLNSLLIDFNVADLDESASLVHLLKQSEISAKAVKTITASLQNLYNKVIYKAQEAIEEERKALVPSIHSITVAINNYNEIREAFRKAQVKLGEDKYSSLKEELLILVKEIEKDTQHLIEQDVKFSNQEPKILEKIIVNLILQQEINDYFTRYNYSYVEVKDYIEKINTLKSRLDNNIVDLKNIYLKRLNEQLSQNLKLSIEEQLLLWQKVEKELDSSIKSFKEKDIYFPELFNQKAKILTIKTKFVISRIKKYDFPNHYLDEYKEMLEMIANYLSFEEEKEFKIPELLDQIDFYRVHIKETFQLAKKLEKIINLEENILNFHNDYCRISDFISQYQDNFVGSFKDTSKDMKWLNTTYLALSRYMNNYIAKNAWRGNLILQAPNSQTKIILLDKAQVVIGRARGKGNLITNNRISLPWARLSGQHLEIDFQQGVINDLDSTNGTYINKIPNKINRELLNSVTEFNLASDLTFKIFYEPNSFSGFIFTNFSTNYDKILAHTTKNNLTELLEHCFFIYLPAGNSETKLFIRKYDGKPIYGNDMLDYNDCFIIQRDNDVFYYSDYEEDIIHLPIMKNNNPKLKLLFKRIII